MLLKILKILILEDFLNLVHTFAHAIESMSFNKIPHGIAVSFGLRIALSISFDLYNFPKEKINSLNLFLKVLGLVELWALH